jgi:hypothetical protein
MAGSEWQLLIVVAIVAGAAGYVARSFFSSLLARGGCGGCGGKTGKASQADAPLISSDSIVMRPARKSTELDATATVWTSGKLEPRQLPHFSSDALDLRPVRRSTEGQSDQSN